MAKREKPPSDFLSKTELANHLACSTQSLDNWIADGSLPPPHSRPGRNHAVWLREHYEHFKIYGNWPKEAWERPASPVGLNKVAG